MLYPETFEEAEGLFPRNQHEDDPELTSHPFPIRLRTSLRDDEYLNIAHIRVRGPCLEEGSCLIEEGIGIVVF